MDQRVRVKLNNRGGTRRTPYYVRGKIGRIVKSHGTITGHGHDHAEDWGPLYTLLFDSGDVFGSSENEKIFVDLHDNWLESIT